MTVAERQIQTSGQRAMRPAIALISMVLSCAMGVRGSSVEPARAMAPASLAAAPLSDAGRLVAVDSSATRASLECSPSLAPCDGACVDVNADRLNCGECHTTCVSPCLGGRCAARVAVPSWSMDACVYGRRIYSPGPSQGEIARNDVDAPASTAPELLVRSAKNPRHLAVDDDNLYWTEETSNNGVPRTTLMKVALHDAPGASSVELASAGEFRVTSLRLGGASVYWTQEQQSALPAQRRPASILSVPKLGGNVTTIVTRASSMGELALNSTALSWFEDTSSTRREPEPHGRLMTMRIQGGAVRVLGEHVIAYSLALDEASAYVVVRLNDGECAAARYTLTSGARKVVAPVPCRSRLASDDRYLYWTTRDPRNRDDTDHPEASTVMAKPLAGGDAITLALSPNGEFAAEDIRVDETNVYFTAELKDADGYEGMNWFRLRKPTNN